jgi:chromosome segregation ATPase
MSSGNFCLVADNLQSMNEKCKRLEQDKQRLNGQLNQMLKTYKDLQVQHDVQHKITDQDEEGLQSTFTEFAKQVKGLEKTNEMLSQDNESLRAEINTQKSKSASLRTQLEAHAIKTKSAAATLEASNVSKNMSSSTPLKEKLNQ